MYRFDRTLSENIVIEKKLVFKTTKLINDEKS